MPTEKKLRDLGTTRSAEAVADLAQQLIDASIIEQTTRAVMIRIFASTHDILKEIKIPNEAKLQEFLRAMIKGTLFETSSIQSRERSPKAKEFEFDEKVGGQTTIVGQYPGNGCYNIWFERGPQQEWILAYSKVPVGGNLR